MADQWIDAATALSIVSKDAFDRAGKISLCTRAHQGLVRAHARLFVSSRSGTDDRRARDFLIPRNLWWAQGHEALEQDWKSGDFSTWIDRRIHLQAFGTRFALTDVLEMLSYEQRAGIARRLSVVGSEEWVSTPKAIELIKGVEVARDPKQFIVEQARLGFIAARAIEAQRFEEHSQTEPLWAEREWDVPSWFWERRGWCSEDEDWGTGEFKSREAEGVGSGLIRVNGLHFRADSLEAMLPSRSGSMSTETAHQDAPDRPGLGGRLPQAWWDDMWCDIWALVYQGDLKPTSQADVERAMQAWAENSGKSMSEATARPKARKLFKALRGEATNFLESGS